MQGLADGYFVIPYTLGNYLAGVNAAQLADTKDAAFKAAEAEVKSSVDKLLSIKGKRSVDSFHRELGNIMWEYCGMARNKEGLQTALQKIPALREQFWSEVNVLGGAETLNQSLENAGRVADFLEFGELMCRDALVREESCGGHFRTEYQVDGEAQRDDENFCHAAVWEYKGAGVEPARHVESLTFENVKLATRSYK
jgi:succinate dehydrogenase / fumarate reductase, flavoprotein subunit